MRIGLVVLSAAAILMATSCCAGFHPRDPIAGESQFPGPCRSYNTLFNPSGTTLTITTYDYDTGGKLVKTVSKFGVEESDQMETRYFYLDDGREDRQEFYDDGELHHSLVSVYAEGETLPQRMDFVDADGESNSTVHLAFDENGQLVSEETTTFPEEGEEQVDVVTHEYDALGLKTATRDGGNVRRYLYDRARNLIASYSARSDATVFETEVYTYDCW